MALIAIARQDTWEIAAKNWSLALRTIARILWYALKINVCVLRINYVRVAHNNHVEMVAPAMTYLMVTTNASVRVAGRDAIA